MAIVMLAIGVLLGFGPAFAVGYFGWNWWSIPILAMISLVVSRPVAIYNQLWLANRRGRIGGALVSSIVVPAALQTIVLTILFALGRWLGGGFS